MADLQEQTGQSRRVARSAIWGWLLFDWAAQPVFALVTTFVFAPYFAARLADTPVEGQALWGYAVGCAGAVIALFSPFLGAVADRAGQRKPWVALFSVFLIVGCLMLWWAGPGMPYAIGFALLGFVLATIGVEFATTFTNAMMPDLVNKEALGRLSGTGWAIGYVGGLVSLVLVLGFMVADATSGLTVFGLQPVLGLDPAMAEGDRASGPFAALWYSVFVLPLFFFTPDVPRREGMRSAFRHGFGDLRKTLVHVGRFRSVLLYLLAHMIYIDGLAALFAFGGIYAAGIFGWQALQIGIFGIVLTIVGVFGAYIGGRLDDRHGSRPVLIGSLSLLILATCGIVSTGSDRVFFIFAVAGSTADTALFATLPEQIYLLFGCVIGLAAGPLQAASRTYLVRLAPQEHLTQFFGLYALSGKVTSFLGPLSVGLLTSFSGSQRIGVSAIIVFLIVGMILLLRVPDERA